MATEKLFFHVPWFYKTAAITKNKNKTMIKTTKAIANIYWILPVVRHWSMFYWHYFMPSS